MLTIMADHGVKAVGPGIERYLRDEGMTECEEDLETAVMFPVAKD